MYKNINAMLRFIVQSLPEGFLNRDIKSLLINTIVEIKEYFQSLALRISSSDYDKLNLACVILAGVTFFIGVVGYISYYCGCHKTQVWLAKAEKRAHEVHTISGTVNPSRAMVQKCMEIINECDHLVNQPMKPHGFTPFLRACYSGNTELVKFMLKKGANIYSQTVSKDSAIYLAAYRVCKTSEKYWNCEILNVLYSAGCDLDVMKPTGHTALHLAARYGNISLVRWLLIHGANPNLRSTRPQSQTPYEIAASYGDSSHQTIAALLHIHIPLGPNVSNMTTSTPNTSPNVLQK